MAIKNSGRPNANGTLDFYADTESDVANLPTDAYYGSVSLVGSACLVIETSEVYILSPSLEWVKL